MQQTSTPLDCGCCHASEAQSLCNSTLVPLATLAKGQKVVIGAVRAKGELGRRLRDMGLLPSVALTVSERAPLGDPLSVSLEGYSISLRIKEAEQIFVLCTE